MVKICGQTGVELCLGWIPGGLCFRSEPDRKGKLPEFSESVSGSAGEYRDRLVDFVIAQGIALELIYCFRVPS